MKKSLALALILLSAGCMEGAPSEVDELAAEDADLGGAADAAGGLYTYYQLRQDFRRCIYPLCGGYWVSRVNRSTLTCADGSHADECYVAELDFSALGASDEETATLNGAASGGRALLRGSLSTTTIGDFTIGTLVATEAWIAPTDFVPEGIYVRVADNGIRCITYPCSSLHEAKLNSSLDAEIADIDFSASGATEDEIAKAQESLASGGLLIAGYRYSTSGPAGRARARTATAFWLPFTHQASGTGECFVGGCSGQVCTDQTDLITTCEWRESYACYRNAPCERQADGNCGWTETPELEACLAGSI